MIRGNWGTSRLLHICNVRQGESMFLGCAVVPKMTWLILVHKFVSIFILFIFVCQFNSIPDLFSYSFKISARIVRMMMA